MALTATLRILARHQGEILGSVVQKGREGRIAVLESNHQVAVSIDPATGLASGRPQHRPFVVVKEIDRATPALYQALLNHEVLTEFEVQYWAPSKGRSGAELMRYAVLLGNARIESIRFVQADVLDPALKAFPEAEELSLSYERITWTWTQPASSTSADGMEAGARGSGPSRPATRKKPAKAAGQSA